MEYNEIKQQEDIIINIQIISNISENQQKIKDLHSFLKTQHSEYNKAQKKERKELKNKFSSFENLINRPPFFSETHIEQTFHGYEFIDNEVPVLIATQKAQFIMPSSNNSLKITTFKIEHQLSKLQSDFPNLKQNQMSEKEIKRLENGKLSQMKGQIYKQNKYNCKSIQAKQTIDWKSQEKRTRIQAYSSIFVSKYQFTPFGFSNLHQFQKIYQLKEDYKNQQFNKVLRKKSADTNNNYF